LSIKFNLLKGVAQEQCYQIEVAYEQSQGDHWVREYSSKQGVRSLELFGF